MRIIAGRFRGRILQAPKGMATRPMLDRVRESMFSTLMPWLDGARVLDLFAGSGCLSLEALSRGSKEARLVERDADTVGLIQDNLAALGLEESAQTVRGDALDPRNWALGDGWDIVFLDPPYPLLDDSDTRAPLMEALELLVGTALAEEGVVVFHAPKRKLDADSFPAHFAVRERVHGSNSLWYIQPD